MPEKFAAYCKATRQTAPHSQGEFVRCAMESLALAYRHAFEGLQAIRGTKIERIHIVGGGTHHTVLNQMTADACGVEVVTGPIEATATGNIIGQLIADRQIKSVAEGREIVAASFKTKRYTPRDRGAWEDAYGHYRKLLGKKVSEKI
jgi:sugar (pentulose or hexulose) kinase